MKHCESTLKLAAKMELQNTNRSSRVMVKLSTKQQSITFNVLPAFNALGELSWVCRVVGRVGGMGLEGLVKRTKPMKGVVGSMGME